ncbi:FAD-binding and (Fe-S)-binding domain-containing protein [Georgenia faecalis]|uniref:D-lactate dehydrogenase (cytochrome) n=1 Tax=Georgenia faecalis TaxID=2483799 RepID=A0ABV9D6H8_9MICO|nr:FAD-binding and (Fe-S)-binding domain-containing protein [Georgenia faecalis]
MTIDQDTQSLADLGPLGAAAGAEHLSTSVVDRARLAHDASHYLLTPRAVVTATSTEQVAAVLAAASRHGTPLTFRSGGTSLSGQAVSDGVLVDVRRHQGAVTVLDGGARVRCQPGAVLRRVNAALAPYGRRLGPDPASETACTIGGVVANNSSGMTSGTTATAYRTLESMVLVLPSGTVLDTGAPDADAVLRAREPALHAGLLRLRDRVRSRADLRARIEHQFSMKNTMGYALNALLDHDDAVDVLAHLVVGSEGTLAYVAEVTLRTVPALTHVATALCVFDSIDRATDAIAPLTAAGAVAIELMDPSSLRVAQADPKADDVMRAIAVEHHTALLVELQETDREALAAARAVMEPVLGDLRLSAPATLTTDPAARARMWAVRKGLYAAVAGARPQGTTALLEDIVVPPAALTGTVKELGMLLARYGYDDAVTFGHAKDANLHFMINPHLEDRRELDAYAAFTEDLVDLILGADGSLKAEHGTGRIMAPYVRRQYGDDLYDVMREVKALCDPARVLNPGVLLDDDPRAHLRHLKIVPPVHPELDRCVECGYCEPVCPSRNTTTTPRQRITLLRDMARATPEVRRELADAYPYQGVQTCAADSLCVTACPVSIDTGAVMKSFRAEARPAPVRAGGTLAARAWGPTTAALRTALRVAEVVPGRALSGLTAGVRKVAGQTLRDWIPQVGSDLPGAGGSRARLAAASPAVVAGLPSASRPSAGRPSAGRPSAGPPSASRPSATPPASSAPAPAGTEPGGLSAAEGNPATTANQGDLPQTLPHGRARAGGPVPVPAATEPVDVVFFPACIGSLFAPEGEGQGAGAAFLRLCERAGLRVAVPEGIDQMCCGTVWESKGLVDGATVMARTVAAAVWGLTDGGRVPVVCDASSCTHGLTGIGKRLEGELAERWASVHVVDAVSFARERLLPALDVPEDRKLPTLAVHPTCSAVHLGAVGDLEAVSRAVAGEVTVPVGWGCCGTAGDRGMLHPELTAGATEMEAAEIAADEAANGPFSAYASCNRTCEMGMTAATGRPYRHVLELLEEVTRPGR